MSEVRTEDPATYATSNGTENNNNDDEIIRQALAIIDRRYRREGAIMGTESAKDFAKLHLGPHPNECFAVIFLDQRNRIIAFEKLFHGTIDSAAVFARPLVKRALDHNAAAVILAHNHPSGVTNPSQADHQITGRLRDALALIDVRVLDHLVVGEEVYSMAEHGQM